MKSLWISPPLRRPGNRPPMGLAVLDQLIRKIGHDSKILFLDDRAESWKEEISKHLDCDLYGVTLFDEGLYYGEKMVRFLRHHTNARILVGGRSALGDVKLVKQVFGGMADVCSIDGPQFLGLGKATDLDNILIGAQFANRRFAVNRTMKSFGCPFTCSFCGTSPLQMRPNDKVLTECRRIAARGYRRILFYDGTFTLGQWKELVREWLADPILRYVKISLTSRIDTLNEESMELISKVCYSMLVGLEGFTDDTLNYFSKGTTLKKIDWAMDLFARYPDIIYTLCFITGLPWEKRTHFKQSAEYVQRISAKIEKPVWLVGLMTPLLGTQFAKDYPSPLYNPLTPNPRDFYYKVDRPAVYELLDLAASLSYRTTLEL